NVFYQLLFFDYLLYDRFAARHSELEPIVVARLFQWFRGGLQLPAGAHGMFQDESALLGGTVLDRVGLALLKLARRAENALGHLDGDEFSRRRLAFGLDFHALVDGVGKQALFL